jgi:hypothetical protein
MELNSVLQAHAHVARARTLDVGIPLQDWPTPEMNKVPENAQAAYFANRLAVELWANMVPETLILRRLKNDHGVTLRQGRIARIVKRCLQVNPRTMRIYGFYGCIPSKHLPKLRPISMSGAEKEKGDAKQPKDNPRARQLGKLFAEHPKIEASMVLLAKTRSLKKGMAPFAALTPGIVIDCFHSLCQEAGLAKEGKWPFAPGLKKQGAEAIRRWYHYKKFDHPSRAALNELGDELGTTLSRDYRRIGIRPMGATLKLAYERVEMDEHYRDAMWVAMWPMGNDRFHKIQTRRLWGMAALECSCKLVLGTNMAVGEKYNRADVMRLVYNSLVPPPCPEKLMLDDPQYVLHPEARYPAEIPEFARNSFMQFAYDGDSSHLSPETLEALERVLHSEIAAERIGDWTGRPNIEGWFGKLAEFDAHSPAATGNSPESPARRDPEKGAEEINLYMPLAFESLDLLGRTHNITPLRCLDGDTPLERLAEMTKQGRVFRSPIGELGRGNLHLLLPRYPVKLSAYRAATKGHGVLGTNFQYAWYTSKELNDNKELRFAPDQSAWLYVQEDARFAWLVPNAFPNDRYLVAVTGRLASTPHTLQWRMFHGQLGRHRAAAGRATLPHLGIGHLRALSHVAGDNAAFATLTAGFATFMERHGRGQVTEVDVTKSQLEAALDYSQSFDSDETEQPIASGSQPGNRSPASSQEPESNPPSPTGGNDFLGIKGGRK